ncbi:MAG: hypothetical protein J6T92_08000 [Ottowia sp.]|nr:hypothetical protein [Ottowia sp.]
MNTIRRIETVLVRRFNAAAFSGARPYEVCLETDEEQHWHVAIRRLTPFSLRHSNRNIPEYLFFDRHKNVYLQRPLRWGQMPPEVYEPMVEALDRVNRKYKRTHTLVYKKISHEEAGIIVEQAAQVLARVHDLYRDSGLVPPPIFDD